MREYNDSIFIRIEEKKCLYRITQFLDLDPNKDPLKWYKNDHYNLPLIMSYSKKGIINHQGVHNQGDSLETIKHVFGINNIEHETISPIEFIRNSRTIGISKGLNEIKEFKTYEFDPERI